MRIFLADLGHNQLTISSDVYPLGVANLSMYLKRFAKSPGKLDVSIYRDPQDLRAAIDAAAPDVLGLSSYSWNHNLALSFARYVKARRPDTLTLMGGPNFPLTPGEQEKLLREMHDIDIAVRGPTYEGERALLNLIERYTATGQSLDGIYEEPVAGNLWINRRTGAFMQGREVERIENLDEIPSPYLAGLLDPFFTTGYLPMMQISRGCPFTCTFCNSSVRSNSKVYAHSLENVKADLLYIAEHVQREVALTFADDNFGMYPLDEEVADYISFLQQRYGWPRYIRTTTGKNRGERIIKVMRKIRGALPMTAAVQSMNPVVLHNIERSNIKLATYTEIQREVRAQGMQSYGELILGLPGETKESFLQGVRDLMEAGVKRVSAHQLMLLHGAPLSNPDSRKRFGMKTKFRVVARNIGNYTGTPVIETEEMVTGTETFSFQDYLDCRVFHLLLTIFYYEGNLEEAFEFARQRGVKPFDLVFRMQELLEQAPPAFRRVIEDFVRESQEEMFASPAECVSWAEKNFAGLVSGDLGGNLLSKYSLIGRFYVAHEALEFLETVLRDILPMGAGAQEDQLAAVFKYLHSVVLHVPFAESLQAAPEWTMEYEVEQWIEDKYEKGLDAYRYAGPKTFRAMMAPERKALLEHRLATFGEHPAALGKITRTLFARDFRRNVASLDSARVPSEAA